ncbi:eIF3 subunit 6 protein [Ancylostoma duodenale]|uniref:Eukaryotic translation initiation factor 3 subunit E n=1 Tax=Ancylostoma duodenale TaxID=51022 RepID=A0A0C2FZK9_9BILA|nr:eIF3 subunit 6 protein [Ancylostoma duodenale]
MAEYDLTKRMAPFFDLHLIIPLLEFIEPRKIYDDASLVEMHRHVLMKTNMIDSLTETYQGTPIPKELETKRAEVLKERDILKAKVDPVIEILELDDVKELMESTRDRDGNNKILDFLQQNHNFQLDMIDALFKYAKFMYECGNYTAASVCLYYYRNLVPQADPNYLNALYGKLASEILLQEWDHARDDLVKLRAYIDSNPFDTEWELIHQRAWLMHWALFVYFNYPKGRDDIIEMFLNQQPYLNTIQSFSFLKRLIKVMCPHLLRYLAVAVVTSKNKQKNSLKDLIKVIDIERHNYQDPVTDFLTCLYIKYDFDEAQEKLRQCEEVLSNDFFLTGCLSDFRESARLLIFEMFCRIHQCISIEMLARRLNMSQVEAERWIVDLIRNYRIDGAKIDSKLGQVVMGVKAVSIHEQVMENTKRLTLRAQQIALQLEKARTERKSTV